MRSERGSYLCPFCMGDSGFINKENAANWLGEHIFEWHSAFVVATIPGTRSSKRQKFFSCSCCVRLFFGPYELKNHIARDIDTFINYTHASLLGVNPCQEKE